MDWIVILHFLSEIAYLLIAFGLVFTLSAIRGYQAVINLILGLYLSLLLYFKLPTYLGHFFADLEGVTLAIAQLLLFAFITYLTTTLCNRLLPDRMRGGYFEHFGKKLVLSLAATILIMSFSFQVLPVSEIISTGTPLQTLFTPEAHFFWWLLVPLVVLYFV